MRTASIGIFDSGFGGLTVMKAVKTLLPNENIIYFGDTANLPYGNKSPETILKYSIENAQFLSTLGIKLLIIACHTACSAAYEELKKISSVPVIGMLEPSIDLLKTHSTLDNIALLGTRQTINSGVYQQLISASFPQSVLTALSCPLFVPIVEEGYADHPIAEAVVKEYLIPLKDKGVNAVLLGCTHYPLLESLIQKELGTSTVLIDPGSGCAESAKKLLIEKDLLNLSTSSPCYKFYVSDDPKKFTELGAQFLKHPITHIFSTKD